MHTFNWKVEVVSPGTPLVSDPFSAAKKSKKNVQENIENEEKEDKIAIDKEVLAESQAIDIEKAVKNTVQPKISNLFEKKPTEANGKEKPIKTKSKKQSKEENDDEEEEDDNETSKKEIPKYNPEDFKFPSNRKEYNMKMITFNVNGLRASIGHGLMEYLKAENPDVICLQETKCVIKIILKKI